jgi:hypothetical protein
MRYHNFGTMHGRTHFYNCHTQYIDTAMAMHVCLCIASLGRGTTCTKLSCMQKNAYVLNLKFVVHGITLNDPGSNSL